MVSYFLTRTALTVFVLSTFSLVLSNPLAQSVEAVEKYTLRDNAAECLIGVGLDLSTDYGTVAVVDCDGKEHAVAQATTADYQAMTRRLSLTESEHLHPPYSSFSEEVQDMPRQWKRQVRKRMGQPASTDVGILAELIQSLCGKAESYLGQTITEVLPITPHLTALYDEDLTDALEYLELKSPLKSYPVKYLQTQESCGAFAGHGLGICKSYSNLTACEEEKSNLPTYRVMILSYTKEAFTASLAVTDQALGTHGFDYMNIEAFDLGSSYNDGPFDGDYWDGIGYYIQYIWQSDHAREDVQKVILIGESATDEHFHFVVKETIESLQEETPEILVEDPTFVASRGAAQLHLRLKYEELSENCWLEAMPGLVNQGDL
ncbi:MAG: hypothetical protein Q9227_001028 [Pyrenula ochraceoflavens]